VFGLLGGDPSSHVPDQVMDQMALNLMRTVRMVLPNGNNHRKLCP
jgi:hypothetical protein